MGRLISFEMYHHDNEFIVLELQLTKQSQKITIKRYEGEYMVERMMKNTP